MKSLLRLSLLGAIAVVAASLLWSYPIILAETGIETPLELRMFGYSAEEARAYFAALSEAGRAQYLGPQVLLDWALPGLSALTLLLVVIRRGRRVPLARRGFAVLLTLAAMGADYWENMQVTAALALPSDQLTDEAMQMLSLATQGKIYLWIAAFLVTSGVVIGSLIRTRRARRK